MPEMLAVSVVIPTSERAESLAKTLASLADCGTLPRELVVIDASVDSAANRATLEGWRARTFGRCITKHEPALVRGAAAQRNQGVLATTEPFIWFLDDDILFEPGCTECLWHAIQSDPQLGGVNSMIVNQRYQTPGLVSRSIFALMHGRPETSFAGRVIGPAVNLLPEDRNELAEIVPVEWLNTTCTMYRRTALPDPAFDAAFTGYSLMEDLALSLRVAQSGWKLANVRTARIFHDSQPTDEKTNLEALAAMELRNRHYVMTHVLGRRTAFDYLRLALWELFALVTGSRGLRQMAKTLAGKWRGVREIWRAVD